MDLEKWIEEWCTLETEEQKKDFDVRFRSAVKSIPAEEMPAFKEMFYQSAISNLKEAQELVEVATVRNKLEPILKYVSLSEIASKYFGKTRQWLYQRINGNLVNGMPAKFTSEELKVLKKALNDVSEDIKQVALSI